MSEPFCWTVRFFGILTVIVGFLGAVVAVAVGFGVGVGVGDGVGVGLAVPLAVAVADGDGEGVAVPVPVGVGLAEPVGVAVGVSVGVVLGVAVGVSVGVAVGVAAAVDVAVADDSGVDVGEAVASLVDAASPEVDVAVGTDDCVRLPVLVGLGEWVTLNDVDDGAVVDSAASVAFGSLPAALARGTNIDVIMHSAINPERNARAEPRRLKLIDVLLSGEMVAHSLLRPGDCQRCLQDLRIDQVQVLPLFQLNIPAVNKVAHIDDGVSGMPAVLGDLPVPAVLAD